MTQRRRIGRFHTVRNVWPIDTTSVVLRQSLRRDGVRPWRGRRVRTYVSDTYPRRLRPVSRGPSLRPPRRRLFSKRLFRSPGERRDAFRRRRCSRRKCLERHYRTMCVFGRSRVSRVRDERLRTTETYRFESTPLSRSSPGTPRALDAFDFVLYARRLLRDDLNTFVSTALRQLIVESVTTTSLPFKWK